ncbi:DNA gyrase subunit A [Candidatus Pantoea edessiphila]|uniref:DNA gyrase subunit A n=1 Tax=Candidatus Pantoea edessiphila TaxID=2044610 RepID=A0A2P5T2S2_9GAMM|nr:DNA gyrase subunit A [Candidatus Pantoea edessiphila]
MSNPLKEIIPVSIEEELKNSYLDYAMSVIIGRALPDVRDGFKPVHRRILFAMKELGNDWNKPYKKSARVVGDVIGKYHPHGDSAVYDAIVRMAQSFSLRYMLIDGQGNFGSIDGDSAAAMRYTEIRMSKISHEMLVDLEKSTVNFTQNYDGTNTIPEVLPTKIPNLLINGSSGIAVGMATNIPPHNLNEIINGCLVYIDNENISVKELMNYIPGPDFPTAAIINGQQGIEQAYITGRGKIYIRARSKIEVDIKNGREIIIIYELPYQVNKAHLLEKIAELIKEKRVEGISLLRDESDKDGLRIIIEIKRNSVAEIVLNNLYSLTQLQISFSINMVALHNGQPKIMSLKDILGAFICHRKEIITRRSMFELSKALDRIHILEGLLIALASLDSVIALIRNANTPLEAKSNLISQAWNFSSIKLLFKNINNNFILLDSFEEKFNKVTKICNLSEKQIQAILDLRLHKLTSLECNKLIHEYKFLLNQVSNLNCILQNSRILTNVLREELESIRDQFSDERRTEIITNSIDINTEDLINSENVVVTLSHHGYVKYQPLSDYEAQRRGGRGKSAARIKEEDFICRLLVANTHDIILCFSSRGRLYWMKVYQLPEASRISRGRPIVNLLPLQSNERITAILPMREYTQGFNVFMATANGIVKKTLLKEFSRPRGTGIIAINLQDEDELIGVALTNGNNQVMLFSALGKVVRFSEISVRNMGRTASGVRGIKLAKSDRVVSLIIPNKEGSILTVTKNGYGKRTANNEYPIKSRAIKGIISIKVTKRNGSVVGALQVVDNDQIMIITDAGTLVRTRVSEVNIISRNTQGVILLRTSEKEKVVDIQRVAEPIDNEININ